MASHTPFADPSSFSMRQHLADVLTGPAEMYALAVVYHTDPTAVAVLCEHAKGSFQLLVGLHAAQQHVTAHPVVTAAHSRFRFRDLVVPHVVDQVRDASEADLLEGLATARAVFTGGSTPTFRNGPLYISNLFAAHASDRPLTDRVVAEMSVWRTWGLSPELALEPRERISTRDVRCTRPPSRWAVARLLMSRFGTHVPSWDMFKHLHNPETRIGDIVDLVAAVEQSR